MSARGTRPASAPRAPRAPEAVLDAFHPALRRWFCERFPGGPTEPQVAAWPLIRSGRDVLVASPTGTGKTLTGFMVAMDAALRRDGAEAGGCRETGEGDRRRPGPQVVYVSPLRALAADVQENLQVPLAGARAAADALGLAVPELSVAVRTGDTPPSARAAMRKNPPDLLVTTPESLYLLVTAASSRRWLQGVRTVIVDEVHTLARDKRGAHLSLTLERLEALVAGAGVDETGEGPTPPRLQRIGLSATQRPLEVIGRLLVGAGDRALPEIVDCGLRRDLNVAIELPAAELEAVASRQQLEDVLGRIADHVREHRTTLVFVNTRKMAERIAHQLSERLNGLGDAASSEAVSEWTPERAPPEEGLAVAAHHGSLSAARRKMVEARLRAGELRALVATASLELGIDVGPVELVCQIGSPRSISTFLQRVGRANHQVEGTPAGRLYPLTRDELVECAALLSAARRGHLDAVIPPDAPLDVLAQQLVAEVAGRGEAGTGELYETVRRATPYAGLERADFDLVVELVSSGVTTGRGRRGAYLHHDAVNGVLRPRRGALLAAVSSGGAIPETGDYRVVLDPEGVTIGSVNEDFAVEANIGDVFLLGTHSWRVRQVEVGTVRVTDAGDAAPSVPFWLGEAPARTRELSFEVAGLRARVEGWLSEPETSPDGALGAAPRTADATVRAARELAAWSGIDDPAARQIVAYLAAGRAALGVLPTQRCLVIERFFDDAEGMQLVVHSPYGGRVNRALGLALRKRFCVTFDFELQAAADDDTVVLSLGPQHSFPLSQVPAMVPSASATAVLTQAVLPHPMLAARWRWNCNRALLVLRSWGGKRRPIHLQRMEADDLMAAVWPALAACQENAPPGPIGVPDHVLARQTVADCLVEPLDAAGLVELLRSIEHGEVHVRFVESKEPSVLAHGILSGRPYTFLDGAPLEERRTRAVPLSRGVDTGAGSLPVPPGELAPIDPDALASVLAQLRPRPRDADELHDLLLSLVRCRPVPEWRALFDALERAGRAHWVDGDWAPTERLAQAQAILLDLEAAAECVRGHLDLAGPVEVERLVSSGPLPAGAPFGVPLEVPRVRSALARLEATGAVFELPDGRWCARHLLARLYRASRTRRRHAVEPASVSDLVATLLRFQHATPDTRLEGRGGVLSVIDQLQGIELPAGDWESAVLSARVKGYDPRWLDELCLSGEVAWGRLSARAGGGPERRGVTVPSPASPLALVVRDDLWWQLGAVRVGEAPGEPEVGASFDLLAALRHEGASFRSQLAGAARRLPTEVDEGLWDLVSRGLVTADAFSAVRSLLSARRRAARRSPPARRLALAARRGVSGSGVGEGRWSLLCAPPPPDELFAPLEEELAERVAVQLLVRWGIVMWELWAREPYRIPWRDVVRALRRLEARGRCLGGRFVAGLSGEQYATSEAAELLSSVRGSRDDCDLLLAASDPLNLSGLVVPGPRVPATRRRRVVVRDGTIVAATTASRGTPATLGARTRRDPAV